jgi:multidrug resistance efflux pump
MVWSGRMIAEILDTRGLELQAKVNEADRANMNVGQAAEVRVDGLPAGTFPGTIKTIAGAAARGCSTSEGSPSTGP